MKLLIKNGKIIDAGRLTGLVRDLVVDSVSGRILRVERDIKDKSDKFIDATGKIVMPGVVDMHVHLREPGREDRETIFTGTRAAARGGVTTLLAMPNTCPPIDSIKNIRLVKEIITRDASVNVLICGAITKGRRGRTLCNIEAFKRHGVRAISDDGDPVENERVLLRALRACKKNRIPLISHCEDKGLSGNGVVNLGFASTRLGLRGVPRASEYRAVERDIKLAERVRSGIHIAHVSCRESVEILRKARKRGIRVTAETAPHYFALTEDALLDYNTYMKVNPPLREEADREAIKEGLRDGTIDVIASDHAPHTESEKDIEFDFAESGTIGLETALSVAITELVYPGVIGWEGLVRKMCYNPARILGLDKGLLLPGKAADLTIISPEKERSVRKEDFLSLSKNSAFTGKRLKGKVEVTICGGKIVYPPGEK